MAPRLGPGPMVPTWSDTEQLNNLNIPDKQYNDFKI